MSEKVFSFDVKLFANIEVKGATRKEAEQKLRASLDGSQVNAGMLDDEPLLFEVTIDGEFDLLNEEEASRAAPEEKSIRLKTFLDDKYSVLSFMSLPTPHQKAIVHYMAFMESAWEAFEGLLDDNLDRYVERYGDTLWGVAKIETGYMIDEVMKGVYLDFDFPTWEAYHRWYLDKFADYPRERKALIPYLI